MNELLLWMSVRRRGSEGSLTRKAAELAPGKSGRVAAHRWAEWTLDKLSHCEFGAAAGGGWRVAPPVLAAGDPMLPPRAVLCGARTAGQLDRLRRAAHDRMQIVAQDRGPDVVTVLATSNIELIEIADGAGVPVQWNAALAILATSTPPSRVQLQEIEMPRGGWEVKRFSRSSLSWTPSDVAQADRSADGLFHFRSDRGSHYVLKESWRCFATDAAVGKYRMLGRRQKALRIDMTRGEVSVPIAVRPPGLIERALVSCSGRLPAIEESRLVYGNVSPAVAAAVAAVLRD